MDRNLKLKGFHIKFYDLTTERDNQEWLTSLELTPYFEQLKTSFLMLGTNMGNIFIVDKVNTRENPMLAREIKRAGTTSVFA